MGAPLGNNNGGKGKSFAGALRRALYDAGTEREKLLEIAHALVEKAIEGDLPAIKEVADRLDGKSAQAVIVSGDADNPLQAKITVEYVTAAGGVPVLAPATSG